MTHEKPKLSKEDERLNKYKKDVIDFKLGDMAENKEIADEFVKNFIEFLKVQYNFKYLKYIQQGSAFENVKVFKPNHIDYLLVLSAELEDIPNDTTKKYLKDLFQAEPKYLQEYMAAHKTIQIPEFIKEHTEYKQFCKEWPESETKQECVSSHLMNTWYEAALNDFREMKSNRNIKGAIIVLKPRRGSSALTTEFKKADGSVISVHMTACMRLFSPEGDQYFIPKMLHPEADDVLGRDRGPLLWLQTNSMKEKDAILSKFQHQRDNYRIVKALMYQHELIADDGTESYIIKAIFLRDAIEELLPSEKPTDYLTYFLEALHGAYDLEQKRRGGYTPKDEEKKKDTIQGYKNPQENVLARYRTLEIKSKLGDLNELLKLGKKARVDKLMLKKN